MGPFVYKTCFAQMCDLKEENKPDELCSDPGIAPPELKAAQIAFMELAEQYDKITGRGR
jgi:hypothetical protein